MHKRRGEDEEEGIIDDSLTTFDRNVRKAELRFCMGIVCICHFVNYSRNDVGFDTIFIGKTLGVN